MFFAADTDHIATLDSVTLVKLMKRLMFAECRSCGVPLRAATAPLQITVPDGGEDGRAEWTGGVKSTDYLPHRFCIFQSKAQKLRESDVRLEILKGGVKGAPLRLSDAISEVLLKGGAYIVFCSENMTGAKKNKLVKAIKGAITEGGGDPGKIASIKIYDANQIADWANTHTPVALWLAALQRKRSLSGFLSHEDWGNTSRIREAPWVDSESPRYQPVNQTVAVAERKDPSVNAWSCNQAIKTSLDFLANPKAAVRIVGASGLGKSRFAYQLLLSQASVSDAADHYSTIYADYITVGRELLKLGLEIAQSGSPTILVVDECPDHVHQKLVEYADFKGSNLRIVTIDVETNILLAINTLTIELEKADDALVAAIAKAASVELDNTDARYITEIADGYPGMAVLAAQLNGDRRLTIRSVDQIMDRIIWGQRTPNADALRSLECLCLFDWVDLKNPAAGEAQFIAETLAHMTREQFVEHIQNFEKRGIVLKRGHYFQAGPIPLAARLGANRLERMTAEDLQACFSNAPDKLKRSFLKRLRWFDTSPVARAFARFMLGEEGIGTRVALNSEFGSQCLDGLVHVDPDAAMATIDRVFGDMTRSQLHLVIDGRRYLVWSLEKLAFRKSSFDRAATLLRRLAASENEAGIGNNATGQFVQLFQLHLSGSEADPVAKLRVLDAGLASSDLAEREVCLAALDKMLPASHFSRGGGAEEIGSAQQLEDWYPETYGAIWDYHRAAVTRLTGIALAHDPLAEKARDLLAKNIRGIVDGIPLADVKAMTSQIVDRFGFWPEAVQGISSWLYFDAKEAPAEAVTAIRVFYDELMPDDPVEQALVYANGYTHALYNPDARYERDLATPRDRDYTTRHIKALAMIIGNDPQLIMKAIDAFTPSNAKGAFGFGYELATSTADPLSVFENAVTSANQTNAPVNIRFLGGLISGANARDVEIGRACIRAGLGSARLKPYAAQLIGAGALQPGDLALFIALLRTNDITPNDCFAISNRLDHLTPGELIPLLDELQNHGADGLWTAFDVITMYLHPAKPPAGLLVKKIKRILLAKDLFALKNTGMIESYHLSEMVSAIERADTLDKVFATSMMKQLLRLCEVEDYKIFLDLDDVAREILVRLTTRHPAIVWAAVNKRLVGPPGNVRSRLNHLIEADRDQILGAGVLFQLPPVMIMDWVREKPEKRAEIVVDWMPIAVRKADGTLVVQPELDAYLLEFGGATQVLDRIYWRLTKRYFNDSKSLLPLFEHWKQHEREDVRRWASISVGKLETNIVREQDRRDAALARGPF